MEVFIGEFVEVISVLNIGKGEQPASIQGYLLAMDEENYYLGDESGDIDMSIKRDRIFSIIMLKEKSDSGGSKFEKMLHELPGPIKEEDVN